MWMLLAGIRGWACTCSSTSLLLPPNLISGRLPKFIRLVVAHDVARAISSRQPAASAPMGLGLESPEVDILQSSEATVRANIRKYRYYFHNPQDLDDGSWHPHPQRYPTVSLHYPNGQTPERFILLAPRDPNEYAPIMDLESSIYTIAEHYFTAEQQYTLFGPIPMDSGCLPHSQEASPSSDPKNTLLLQLHESLRCRDGPAFVAVVQRFNTIVLSLKANALNAPTTNDEQNTVRAGVLTRVAFASLASLDL
ncbi:Histone-lysine N-methyltransferase, H3 lysine-79 specific [Mycena chlorophos]|uniref:Histone-lysine N-methyltransferase, H3 lysine-79 specific n=1 Tax=Mycena chlorophos TaxID=658473 RepID=A0A8H6TP43_MYCCL|nr:Histone-lysine N-methyltransferase, H3 lysine-79 specific [Mycena chlorophos]